MLQCMEKKIGSMCKYISYDFKQYTHMKYICFHYTRVVTLRREVQRTNT